jgi:hypothetical protein
MSVEKNISRFDLAELHRALDAARQAKDLTWKDLVAEINVPFGQTTSIPISVATIRGLADKSSVTSAVVLQILRWLNRSPESFLPPSAMRFGERETLPDVGPVRILRLDTRLLHRVLDKGRQPRELSWPQVAAALPGFTPSMLMNLAKGPLIGFPRVMILTQRMGRPLAEFVRGTKD